MDVKYINPFLNGTLEVLKTMAFMEARPGKVYVKESNLAAGDVSGIIGITGDATGSLAISFTEACICSIVGRMLGETPAKADREVFDAVGELTNMISGVARTYLEKQGMTVYAAIPTVIYGKDHTIDPVLDSPSIIIPFSTDNGSFVVDVCIKTTDPEERQADQYQVINRRTQVPGGAGTAAREKPASLDAKPAPAAKVPPALRPPPDAASLLARARALPGGSPIYNPVPRETPPPGAGDPAAAGTAPDANRVSLPPEERKEYLRKKIKEFTAARDAMIKELAERPFMEIARRSMLKKQIPQYDAKIKRLMLDVSAIEMMAGIDQEKLDNPVIAPHFQHHDPKNRKR
jgi:chemotaxis protein CheX